MAIGIDDLSTTARLLPRAFRTPILPVFTIICALEGLFILGLPGIGAETVGTMLSDPILGIFGAAGIDMKVIGIVILVVTLFALDLLRQGLWSPLRRVVLDDIELEAGEVVKEAARAIPRLFVTQQVIGIFVFVVSAIAFLIGLTMTTIPHALVTFTLTPAIYLVAAHRRGIGDAVIDAIGITRRNLLAVFGVQGALLAFAYWIGGFLQGQAVEWSVTPYVAAWAVAGFLITYRFVHFFGMSTLFLTLDRTGELDE